MKNYKEINWFTLIGRNILLLIIKIIKSLFFILISLIIFYFSMKFYDKLINIDSLKYMSFIIVFLLINYAFLSLVSSVIEYYNDLIILHEDQIIILQSSLILKDDMEVIDIHKIISLDWFKRGLIQNILWYWDIIVEQQKNEVKVLRFISQPHQILNLLRSQKDKYSNNINNNS